MKELNRRRVLKGVLSGSAVSVALPFMNCFLNGNGDALASGKPIPIRFGSWFWGLGLNKKVAVPTTVGANYELLEELTALKDVKNDINYFTNLTVYKEGPARCHFSGWATARTGIFPTSGGGVQGETIDTTIANQIGTTTRFKQLTATATGDVRTVLSYENSNTPNAPEFAPLNFYIRLFGPEFQDPNADGFTPNPMAMIRKSALSGVIDQVRALERRIGADDKARLDQYFTGVRHLEQQLDQQLTKPEPLAACRPFKAPADDFKAGTDVESVEARHKLMSDLMAMAVACDQTRVFDLSYSAASSNTTKPGYEKPHHTTTHEEPIDPVLGYQPNCSWFVRNAMKSWAYFVQAFANMKEGDGRLLDNVLIMATTDHGYARVHSLEDLPAFTAGRAGGKVKTGLHIAGKDTACTSLGYTCLRVMGVDVPSWGAKGNRTSKEFGEIIA